MLTENLDPLEIQLDFDNPRFSLFNFINEEQIVKHLLEYENLYELINSYINEGYNTLGERIIVLKENRKFTVLEGNRRIAAIKCIFKYTNLLKSSYREKIKNLLLSDFIVSSDLVSDRIDASYKIASKHIASIKDWRSIDKYVYYHNMFYKLLPNNTVKEALDFIKKTTPEPLSEIKKDIKYYNFLSKMHSLVKKEFINLQPLSFLDNDVLTSRVYSALKKELKLREDNWVHLNVPEQKLKEFEEILTVIGKAAWTTKNNTDQKNNLILNTRSFQKQEQWKSIVEENKIIPGLNNLIIKWNSSEENSNQNLNVQTNVVNTNKSKSISEKTVAEQVVKKSDESNSTSDDHKKQQYFNNKYRLFINYDFLKNLIIKNNKDTDLIESILLYDSEGNAIPTKSSEYNKIKFSAPNQEGILIKNSFILKNTIPSPYNIFVSFKEQQVNFEIIVQDMFNNNAKYTTPNFINDKWFSNMTTLLAKNHKYAKIVTTMYSLSKQLKDNMNSMEKSDVLIVSFLIRALLEFISKAYSDKYPEIQKKNTPSDNLPQLIKSVAEDMYSKKPLQFTNEKKKSIKAHDDIELLNGIVHDYNTTLSNQDFKRIFAKYIPYIESVILFLEENN